MSGQAIFNPFVPMGCADMVLEDALKLSAPDWRHLYRQRARTLHPDKSTGMHAAMASDAMAELANVKAYLCVSTEIAIRNAYQFLRSRREHEQAAAAEVENASRTAAKQRVVVDTKQRAEALPGLVLLQGHLSQALRQRQGLQRKFDPSNCVLARRSADALHSIRCQVYKRNVPRTATVEEKTKDEEDLRKKVVRDRCAKALRRCLQGVAVKRAAARLEDVPYCGPTEAAWKRQYYGYGRAGIHNEQIKPEMVKRRLAQQQAQEAEWERSGKDLTREVHRRSRRESKALDDMVCRQMKPPTRAKSSAARKVKKRQHLKANRIGCARACAAGRLCLENAIDMASSSHKDAQPGKKTRRGGGAYRRRHCSHPLLLARPKWKAQPKAPCVYRSA